MDITNTSRSQQINKAYRSIAKRITPLNTLIMLTLGGLGLSSWGRYACPSSALLCKLQPFLWKGTVVAGGAGAATFIFTKLVERRKWQQTVENYKRQEEELNQLQRQLDEARRTLEKKQAAEIQEREKAAQKQAEIQAIIDSIPTESKRKYENHVRYWLGSVEEGRSPLVKAEYDNELIEIFGPWQSLIVRASLSASVYPLRLPQADLTDKHLVDFASGLQTNLPLQTKVKACNNRLIDISNNSQITDQSGQALATIIAQSSGEKHELYLSGTQFTWEGVIVLLETIVAQGGKIAELKLDDKLGLPPKEMHGHFAQLLKRDEMIKLHVSTGSDNDARVTFIKSLLPVNDQTWMTIVLNGANELPLDVLEECKKSIGESVRIQDSQTAKFVEDVIKERYENALEQIFDKLQKSVIINAILEAEHPLREDVDDLTDQQLVAFAAKVHEGPLQRAVSHCKKCTINLSDSPLITDKSSDALAQIIAMSGEGYGLELSGTQYTWNGVTALLQAIINKGGKLTTLSVDGALAQSARPSTLDDLLKQAGETKLIISDL